MTTYDTIYMTSTIRGIRAEISQRRPFRSPHQEGLISLLRTTDLVRRYLSRVVEPHGITLQQYNVLRILRGAGEEGLPTLDIAERMIEQTPGITRLLDRLVTKSLVRRERSAEDRRQVYCWITPKGSALLERLDPEVDQADVNALGDISRAAARSLTEILGNIRAAHAK